MRLASKNKCTACMACVDACNHTVLAPYLNKNGYYEVKVINRECCTECNMCTSACPVLNNGKNIHASHSKPKAFAVWTVDDDLRRQCASGGAFGAIASKVLSQGGVVYGAAIAGFRVRHYRVHSIDELSKLLGSKYQQSETVGIYREVRKDILDGKLVLFSGLSCQVAGLLHFLGKIKHDNLITVDTLCGGLSTMLPMLTLEKSGLYSSIKSFRDKNNGWSATGFKYSLKMIKNDGSVEDLGLDNPVLSTFSSKLLKRLNCLSCEFNGIDRMADISIGDFWGDSHFKEQHEKGLSVAVARTEKGEKMIRNSLTFRPIDIKSIIPGNPNFIGGHYPLVKFLPTRKIALAKLRQEKFKRAWYYMNENTIPGIILKIAAKILKG